MNQTVALTSLNALPGIRLISTMNTYMTTHAGLDRLNALPGIRLISTVHAYALVCNKEYASQCPSGHSSHFHTSLFAYPAMTALRASTRLNALPGIRLISTCLLVTAICCASRPSQCPSGHSSHFHYDNV